MQIRIANRTKPADSVTFYASGLNVSRMLAAYEANCSGDSVEVFFDDFKIFDSLCGLDYWNVIFFGQEFPK